MPGLKLIHVSKKGPVVKEAKPLLCFSTTKDSRLSFNLKMLSYQLRKSPSVDKTIYWSPISIMEFPKLESWHLSIKVGLSHVAKGAVTLAPVSS